MECLASSAGQDTLASIQALPKEELFKAMDTRTEGLTQQEVAQKQEKYGKNVIQEAKGKPLILVFLGNFTSLMAILLWIGGIVAILADMLVLGIAIWLVNIINGGFSFFGRSFRPEKQPKR
ncbi:MAG: cation-transporting P-type ATPase [Oscillospiraceae bacterium]